MFKESKLEKIKRMITQKTQAQRVRSRSISIRKKEQIELKGAEQMQKP